LYRQRKRGMVDENSVGIHEEIVPGYENATGEHERIPTPQSCEPTIIGTESTKTNLEEVLASPMYYCY